MLNFCTLFDSNYLAKGLCMYNSLKEVCSDFHLYIFAFDDKAYNILKQLKLEHVDVISLSEFEDKELLNVKSYRTKAEYCWTSTSSTILYCLNKFDLPHCTYVDADLFFYSDPQVLIDEMEHNDVLITSHRYTSQYDQSFKSGKYCVQFMCFRNTENGLNILNWWRSKCLEWCYNRIEDGKFGDQKYLDDWTTRFEGVHELNNLGGGVAPWNVQQYKIKRAGGFLVGTELATNISFQVVFYHFHHFNNQKINFINEFYFGPYLLSVLTIRLIYNPYIAELKRTDKFLRSIDSDFDFLGSSVTKLSLLRLIGHTIKQSVKRNKIIWIR